MSVPRAARSGAVLLMIALTSGVRMGGGGEGEGFWLVVVVEGMVVIV